ncbi:hybrid sensor histidine kinase/response regulator [Limnohabitans sp.]|uniref:hybrid sensor histidine kinase/response regulator n=1 Tax=Limnohabitans sp. TaxID=1907725 RepID=UPI0038BAC30D
MQLTLAASVLFYALDNPAYDHRIYLFCAATGLVLMLMLQRGVSTLFAANVLLVMGLFTFTWVSAQTGGVNSQKNIWTSLLPMVALLTAGRTASLWWLGLISVVQMGLMAVGVAGWIDTRVDLQQAVAWGVLNQVCVVGAWVMGIYLYERMYRQQVVANEQRNQELETTSQDLLRAQAHKDEFMASVGHELRTPMNAILGFNGLLRSQLEDRPEDVAVVDHIRRATEQLLQVVDDILDFSQLQAGRCVLHAETFDVSQAITRMLVPYQARAKAKGLGMGLTFTPAAPVWTHADKARLTQIVHNLVDNAIKFTHQGRIDVRVAWSTQGLEVVVQDTGIGIAPDRQQVIFDRFEHANIQTNRQYGGTGLGMAICERLVALQGGTLGLSSELGSGSRFWFKLPLPQVPAPSIAGVGATDVTQEALRFLVVDDNAVNLMVAGLMLKKHFPNAKLQQADSAAHALELLGAERFDVVLMDMMMPGMDGLEATRILRHTFPAPTCDMPVLALTASVNPVDRERCLASGMDDVLHKPLDPSETVEHITRCVLQHRNKAAS